MRRKKLSTPALIAPAAEPNALDRIIAIAPAPLLLGENQADYADIAARILGASGPQDAIEDLLVRDVVDLTWEILRLRRVKAGIVRASTSAGVHRVLLGVGYPMATGKS